MSEVDRDAATKEDGDFTNSTVDREGITVDAEFSNNGNWAWQQLISNLMSTLAALWVAKQTLQEKEPLKGSNYCIVVVGFAKCAWALAFSDS